jgi:5-methylcytosine-specific restriction endonuclease McrBC GTP-binding regulatory subunit McrB
LRLDDRTLRRYHLSLLTRGFVVLAGVSGTGKTWLAEAYAKAAGAKHALISVAPNWTTNEDLLGYFNPVTQRYHDTSFSRFIRLAADAYYLAASRAKTPQPYHLILDEMNLARVEYYFASFLSAMEIRARHGVATMDIGGGDQLELTPNLFVIGTVNIDETTHGFADKVWDRAQLVEIDLPQQLIATHLAGTPYSDDVLDIWETVRSVGPFAFRVVDDIAAYVAAAEEVGVPWQEAVDEQILQKILPKLKGTNPGVRLALERLVELLEERYPLSSERSQQMLEGFHQYGFASYFA